MWNNREPNPRAYRSTLRMDEQPIPEYDAEHAWMLDGLCRDRDPSFFFPSDGVGVDQARRVCATCPAKEPCLEYALRYRIEHGVWGGASERERRRILRSRRIALSSL